MTGSRDFKRLVRQRMAETGESYTVARSHFDPPPKATRTRRADPSAMPTTVAEFKKKIYGRGRTKGLAAHLDATYDARVTELTELDVGVYRVDRRGAASWVARVFPRARSVEVVRGDAEILAYLATHEFPAERIAHPEPVSTLAGQPVLITEYAPGSNRRFDASEQTIHALGTMLGRLHALPAGSGACTRPGGSWHHLSVNGGGRRSDIEILTMLFRDFESGLVDVDRSLLAELLEELEGIDDLDDLPKALGHPDACSANLVAVDGDDGVLVDWTGAGLAPRIAGLANVVGTVTLLAHVDAAVAGYRRYVSLTEPELDRLEGALFCFPFVLDCWSVLFQGVPLSNVLGHLTRHRTRASAIAQRIRAAFAAPPEDVAGDQNENQPTLF